MTVLPRKKVATMNSIGIQTIAPKSGTSQHQSQSYDNDNDTDTRSAATSETQAPPPEGMGKLVDKTV